MRDLGDAARQCGLVAGSDGCGRENDVVETLSEVDQGGMGTARVSAGAVQMQQARVDVAFAVGVWCREGWMGSGH